MCSQGIYPPTLGGFPTSVPIKTAMLRHWEEFASAAGLPPLDQEKKKNDHHHHLALILIFLKLDKPAAGKIEVHARSITLARAVAHAPQVHHPDHTERNLL